MSRIVSHQIPAESEMSRQNRATPPQIKVSYLSLSGPPCRTFLWLVEGFAALLDSENGSHYRGVSQLVSHQSRHSVQIRRLQKSAEFPTGLSGKLLDNVWSLRYREEKEYTTTKKLLASGKLSGPWLIQRNPIKETARLCSVAPLSFSKEQVSHGSRVVYGFFLPEDMHPWRWPHEAEKIHLPYSNSVLKLKTFISCYRTPRPEKGFWRFSEGVFEGVSEGFSHLSAEGPFDFPSKRLQEPCENRSRRRRNRWCVRLPGA